SPGYRTRPPPPRPEVLSVPHRQESIELIEDGLLQGQYDKEATPMHVLTKETAPRYTRPEGITSYLLASPRTSGAEQLTTTLAVLQPGGAQRMHSHRPEQVYFILEGSGLMTVGGETRRVGAGDCVFIPSGLPH